MKPKFMAAKNKFIAKAIALPLSVLILSIIAGYVIFAWVEPISTAPGANTLAPINTGTTAQTKLSALGFGNGTTFGLSYWIDKIGDSLAFKNNSGAYRFVLGQDGNVGVGTDTPSQKLDVAGGNIKGDQLCIGTDCRSSWPGGVTAQSCPTGQGVIGIDASGALICSGSSFNPFNYSCSQTLPAGAKKIFVTSSVYSAYDVPNEITADAKCQAAANAVGFPGTYRALTYMGNRNINQTMPSGNSFWNGQSVGISCTWNMVAANVSDFFTDEGGGIYLPNPILYNEQGLSMSGVGVWTGFRPIGGGNYDLLSHALMSCHSWHASQECNAGFQGGCYKRSTYSSPNSSCGYYKEVSHWYGVAGARNVQWGFNDWCQQSATYATTVWDNCYNTMRALYCVEQ